MVSGEKSKMLNLKHIIVVLLCLSLTLISVINHVTGGDSEWHTSNLDFSAEILEYTRYNGYTDWRKVGALKTSRSYHGISLVNFKDFDDYCN